MVAPNKNLFLISLVLLITATLIISATTQQKVEIEKVILVSAASSLAVAIEEIIDKFNSLHPDITIRVSFGGSGYLATQIENGAPVDILISADERDADRLIIKNIARRESKNILCRNTLVLAGFGDQLQKNPLKELRKILETSNKIGIGNPDYVAAGLYTKNLLSKAGLFAKYSTKFIKGNSVRQVVGWLESGEVDYAFIYKSDARLNPNIIIHREYSTIGNLEITYPALLTLKGESNFYAKLFHLFLDSGTSRNILTDYGFMTDKS